MFVRSLTTHKREEGGAWGPEDSAEAAVCRYFSKKVFLKILQYSQENTWFGVSF